MNRTSHPFLTPSSKVNSQETGRQNADSELISRVLAGEPEATTEFIRRYRRLVYALLRRCQVRPQDQDDLYQELYVRLWKRDQQVIRQWQAKGRCQFGAYLVPIIRHLAYDHRRRTLYRDGKKEMPSAAYHHILNTTEETTSNMAIEENLICMERNLILREAIGQMRKRDAELLQRRYFLGQKYEEIALAMGLSIDNVGVSLRRAHQRLRGMLSDSQPDLFADDAVVRSTQA